MLWVLLDARCNDKSNPFPTDLAEKSVQLPSVFMSFKKVEGETKRGNFTFIL